MADVSGHAAFEQILDYLRHARGFDFTAYKPSSLMRRVRKRMQAVDIDAFEDYLDYLQIHPDEFSALFNTILINVTSFYRDPDVWEAVATQAVPQLLQARDGEPIRVWSAGCASGQEAYSAAMTLAEAMGVEDFKARVKIYATDADGEALAEARHAAYSATQIADVRPDLVEKYFERNGELYTFHRDLRRSVIFGCHDLIQDAPISRVDLLLCRNTLMYFNAEAQGRIMARFSFSVNPGGYLVLGRAEMLFSHAAMFSPVDLKHRIFTTVAKPNQLERMRPTAQSSKEDGMSQYELTHSKQELETAYEELQSTNEELETTNEELETMNDELRNRGVEINSANEFLEAVFTSLRHAVVVVDREMRVQVWNAGATELWGLRRDEAQRAYFFSLDIGLPVAELHQPMKDVLRGGAPQREVSLAATSRKGKSLQCRVTLSPLLAADRTVIGAILMMQDLASSRPSPCRP